MRRICIVLPCRLLAFAALAALLPPAVRAQSSSSSPTPSTQQQPENNPATRPRVAQIEEGGSAVTLEISEPLFHLAAALNACGYDADLDRSAPVRAEVRAEMNAALAASEPARLSRDKLCAYITLHRLNDTGLDVGQYVSLALYLSPPPELTPNVDETDLPPQAAAVVNVLVLLRDFGDKIGLHLIWLHHRAAYEALTARVHDPMTRMILDTNIYLHQPVSSYDGRRFLVLLEPMLAPALTNARVYGSDYIIVTSPSSSVTEVPVRIDQIRHIYLHYVVEPMVYSRGAAMERIQPILRGVQDAPIEFFYKSDAVALITECLIKAIEARTYTIAAPVPKRPGSRERVDEERYTALKTLYDKQTSVARQQLVTADETEGWVLTGYFYNQLAVMDKNGDGLRDEIAPMIYGMDVDRERKHAESIVFAKTAPGDPLRAAPRSRKVEGLDLAELDLMRGNLGDAADLADAAMADTRTDHGRARYVLARIDLMHGDPEAASKGFEETLRTTKDPRTLAWSHIYLGRLYDTQSPPAREKALAEYKTALEVRDSRPDTRRAAEDGLKAPFALPLRANAKPQPAKDNEKDFDPTGKAEKDSYKPTPPQ